MNQRNPNIDNPKSMNIPQVHIPYANVFLLVTNAHAEPPTIVIGQIKQLAQKNEPLFESFMFPQYAVCVG